MIDNPFVLEPYYSKEYFCDREEDTETLLRFIKNRQNVTLMSPRRYGKTGLIYRVFDELTYDGSDYECYYADIYSALCLGDFIRLLSEAVVNILRKETLIKKFLTALGTIRPIISYDAINSKYSLSYSFQSIEQKQLTLKAILSYLEKQDKKIVLAIDEFQQVREFEDVKMEALLRTYIQPLHNVRFIFCGSKKHMMINMFTDPTSPFYDSTECMYLEKIDATAYKSFIRENFASGGRTIDDESLDYIMEWTLGHTFYTQNLCNRLYASGEKDITLPVTIKTSTKILKQRENTFLEQRNLLTKGQWLYLIAVAKEGIVTKPTSGKFLNKYKLGAPSASKRMMQALVDKELILETTSLTDNQYRVYNVFMMRWLQGLSI